MGAKVSILFGYLDERLLDSPTRNADKLMGSRRQAMQFLRLLKKNKSILEKHRCKSYKHGECTIRRTREQTPEVKQLLQNIPLEFWPTALSIKSPSGSLQLIQPLHAAPFWGCCGEELYGLIGCQLAAALKGAATNAQKFAEIFVKESRNMLSAYHQEWDLLKKTGVVVRGNAIVYDSSYMPHRKRLNFKKMKQALGRRYNADIERKLANPLKTRELYTLLDQIFIQ